MKVDKASARHWMLLFGFFLQGLFGVVRRCLRRGGPRRAVVFYGHKLNGNLLALHGYIEDNPALGLQAVFLTMDAAYHRELQAMGVDSRWASSSGCSRLLADATAIITSHGLHSLQPLRGLYRMLGLRFFDVWHGIPYKGFDADDFRTQHKYDETWVASELNRELYIRKFGFPEERVAATGYARTDRLVRGGDGVTAAARAALGLPETGRFILFAPTWTQDSAGRSLFPFGCDAQTFIAEVAGIAARHGADIVLRTHLNSGELDLGVYPNVHALPASRYPDAEAVLQACDILVCDWSSIAFDFLLLDRPAIFLDVEPPFRKGFSLGPEYRYGAVVGSLEALSDMLEQVLGQSEAYWQVHEASHRDIREAVYGGLDDGHASQRCVQRLLQAVTAGSSR